ncbi:DNA-directed RNA polymerase II largest subunit RPB1 [Giardia muris]|uniref:DNA-directed RNA polymerase subunit n=1 Tax=Giardia muris TaxID=5742 RepID=A0A4Z1SNC8_GIAMU|nr:DNA-directed RNA polymerase II largest subunit RPB1 [Giardia muris]|eukprot:TNJ27272.1 DNA-directed RNA polymerase II largest subunit RPB1 [Giardia muris]
MTSRSLNIPYGRPEAVRFSLFSGREKENFYRLTDVDNPHHALNSTEFGAIMAGELCPVCRGVASGLNHSALCPGHYGSIGFTTPIYHPLIVDKLAVLMTCFCPICRRLKLRRKFATTQPAASTLLDTATALSTRRTRDDEKLDRALEQELARIRDTTPALGFIEAVRDASEMIRCCGTLTHYKAKHHTAKVADQGKEPVIVVVTQKDKDKDERELVASDCQHYIASYSTADILRLGLERDHLLNFIITSIQVTARSARPTVSDGSRISNDQLTDTYVELLRRSVSDRTQALSANQRSSANDIYTCYKSLITAKGSEGLGDSSVAKKGIFERLSGKFGRMRLNIMGKRVNYCSRSVITGDPTISIDEVGMPRTVAARLTFPEVVTARNREFLQGLVKNSHSYPGASMIEQKGTIRMLNVPSIDDTARGDDAGGGAVTLDLGDVVHRHLLDGDYVLFNRQPTLHKMSFMGHRIRVLPYSTYRLNLSATTAYNADFDGDEMNCHALQSLEAVAEIKELCLVSKQIVSCKDNRPLVTIVQDVLLGCYILSGKDILLEHSHVCEYMMWIGLPRRCGIGSSGNAAKEGHFLRMHNPSRKAQPGFLAVPAPGHDISGISRVSGPSDPSSSFYGAGSDYPSTLTGDEEGGPHQPERDTSSGSFTSFQSHGQKGHGRPISDAMLTLHSNNGVYYKRPGSNVNTNDLVLLNVPQPAICYPRARWTGKQVFSLFIPAGVCFHTGSFNALEGHADSYVCILDGDVMCGRTAKSVVGGSEGGLIHILFKDYGSEACRAFIDNCQRVVCRFMLDHGFSVGLGDMLADRETARRVAELQGELEPELRKTFIKAVRSEIRMAPGQTRNVAFESSVITTMNTLSTRLEQAAVGRLHHRNAFLIMIQSGSKGKNFNIMQIAASLGQQYLQAQRMPYRFETRRALPHYPPLAVLDAESRGYVFNSFVRGLNPAEFYFHAAGGREGVCDTAVKTADSGYVERKLLKNMESVTLRYDGSVRNDSDEIIAFRYGDDGLDSHYCENGIYTDITLSDADFFAKHWIDWAEVFGLNSATMATTTASVFRSILDRFTEAVKTNVLAKVVDGISFETIRDEQFHANGFDSVVISTYLVDNAELLRYLEQHYTMFIADPACWRTLPQAQTRWADDALRSHIHADIENVLAKTTIEYIALLVERLWLQRSRIRAGVSGVKFPFSIDVNRVLLEVATRKRIGKSNRFAPRAEWECTLSPVECIQRVTQLLAELARVRPREATMYRVVLRQALSSANCCYHHRFTLDELETVIGKLRAAFFKGQVSAGEPVGPLAGHSISEPATQLTLNTFHTAGTSALGNLGLPRLKELLDFRESRVPISTIYIDPATVETGDATHSSCFARNAAEALVRYQEQSRAWMRLAAQIEHTRFRYYTETFDIVFDPFDGRSLVDADRDWLQWQVELGYLPPASTTGSDPKFSPFVLRYTLGLRQLQQKIEAGIDVAYIARRLDDFFERLFKGHTLVSRQRDGDGDEDEEETRIDERTRKLLSVFGRERPRIAYFAGIGEAIIRIRPALTNEERQQISSKMNNDGIGIDRYTEIHTALSDCTISGNENIKKVFMGNESSALIHYGWDKYTSGLDLTQPDVRKRFGMLGITPMIKTAPGEENDDVGGTREAHELILQTEGSNLSWLLQQPGVDPTRTWTNNLPEVYAVLGIEAARTLLLKQMRQTLSSVELNVHHFLMLCDIMTERPQKGSMISINRFGMRNTNTGVLAQATFEQPGMMLLNAAAYGVVDHLKSVSSCVLMGKLGSFGTGCFDLLLKLDSLPEPPNRDDIFPNSMYRLYLAEMERNRAQSATGDDAHGFDALTVPMMTPGLTPMGPATTSRHSIHSTQQGPDFTPGDNQLRRSVNSTRVCIDSFRPNLSRLSSVQHSISARTYISSIMNTSSYRTKSVTEIRSRASVAADGKGSKDLGVFFSASSTSYENSANYLSSKSGANVYSSSVNSALPVSASIRQTAMQSSPDQDHRQDEPSSSGSIDW